MHLLILMLFSSVNFSHTATIDDFYKAKTPKSLIFISAECPCSKAHIAHINEITKRHPQIKNFYVATESPLTQKHIQYYKESGLNPIVDEKQILIKKFKALKTPHSIILDQNNKVVYEGGVTNKKDPSSANKMYFEEAALSVSENKTPKITQGRSLGCYIKRI